MFLASRFGLVALIATGYRTLAYVLLATFVLPLITVGVWKIARNERAAEFDQSAMFKKIYES